MVSEIEKEQVIPVDRTPQYLLKSTVEENKLLKDALNEKSLHDEVDKNLKVHSMELVRKVDEEIDFTIA